MFFTDLIGYVKYANAFSYFFNTVNTQHQNKALREVAATPWRSTDFVRYPN